MAAGFKTASVQSGKVSGASHSNFPVYVDLSRLGITTIAEAESVRVYADSGKVTEWAREIVSVSEMHVKVPSLSSSTVIYVDWDGVRSDYAVTATYGRNAVWIDYEGVWHLGEDPSGTAPQMIDSTGNGYDGTSQGTMTSGDSVVAKLGNGLDFDGSNDGVGTSSSVDDAVVTNGVYTYSTWIKADNTSTPRRILDTSNTNNDGVGIFLNSNLINFRHGNGSILSATASYTDTTNFHLIHQRWNGSNVFGYDNGSQVATFAASSITGSTDNFSIGTRTITAGQDFDGIIEEVRVRASDVGANWITTEFNNQNDESTFWGTWSDVSVGYTPTPIVHMMQMAGGVV